MRVNQNRNSGRLDSCLTDAGGGHAVALPLGGAGEEAPLNHGARCISSQTADAGVLNELAPVGSFDPALRENGELCVACAPGSGSVTDVFYMEKEGRVLIQDALALVKDGGDRGKRMSRKADGKPAMADCCGGAAAADIGAKPRPAPGVEALIENGEELKLTVTYTLPEGVPTIGETGKTKVTAGLRLSAGG